jgi:hypothetical protein
LKGNVIWKSGLPSSLPLLILIKRIKVKGEVIWKIAEAPWKAPGVQVLLHT